MGKLLSGYIPPQRMVNERERVRVRRLTEKRKLYSYNPATPEEIRYTHIEELHKVIRMMFNARPETWEAYLTDLAGMVDVFESLK